MEYLGFEITDKQPYYFISYNSEDKERVIPITTELNRNGVPMWCDYGIPYDDAWEAVIAEKIDHCEAVILFYSNTCLREDKKYVHYEYNMARAYNKNIYIVLFEKFPDIKDIPYEKVSWVIELQKYQLLMGDSGDVGQICKELLKKCIKKDEVVSEETSKVTVEKKQSFNHESPKILPKYNKKEVPPKATKKADKSYGETIFFGQYPQGFDGKVKPIEWQILDVKSDGKVLLISKYALECKKYNEKWELVTWETCTLRRWLNQYFYAKAFSQTERAQIVITKVRADKNPNYGTFSGKDTKDAIFLLSIPEIVKYFPTVESRKCIPTSYVTRKGAYQSKKKGTCWWWLRSPGGISNYAAYVRNGGSIHDYGDAVFSDYYCVRPAMWIQL